MGVAYDATISGEQWSSEGLNHLKEYDVANNSWGRTNSFSDNKFTDAETQKQLDSIKEATDVGRAGLGTSIIFAAGNNREGGSNTNYHNLENSQYVVTVGSINQKGDLGKLENVSTPFSTPGASILVSAPGSNITSSSLLLENSNGSFFGNTSSGVDGTSFSAPIISAVTALMLEANKNLGYRDIQKILAMSAKYVEDENTSWQTNGANNWNLGGMHVSHDYGYGNIDAHTAVRLAETWSEINTNNNLSEESYTNNEDSILSNENISISSIIVDKSIDLENAEIVVDLSHKSLKDLIISIISPSGTESILFDQSDSLFHDEDFKFSFNSKQFLNENSFGEWKLKIVDTTSENNGLLNSWELKISGSNKDDNDTYIFTNEYGKQDEGIRFIEDTKGVNTINASSLISDSSININAGEKSIINQTEVQLLEESTSYKEEKESLLTQKQNILSSAEQSVVLNNTTYNNAINRINSIESSISTNNQNLKNLLLEREPITNNMASKLVELNTLDEIISSKYSVYETKNDTFENEKVFFDTYRVVYNDGHQTILTHKTKGTSISIFDYQTKVNNYNAALNSLNVTIAEIQSSESARSTLVDEYNVYKIEDESLVSSYNDIIVNNNSLQEEHQILNNSKEQLLQNIYDSEINVTEIQNEIDKLEINISNISTENTQSIINNIYSGDGNDILIGNALDNILYDGRGNDTLTGNLGNDVFKIKANKNDNDIILDFTNNEDLIDISTFKINSFEHLIITQVGNDTLVLFENNQRLLLKNYDALNLSKENFTGFTSDSFIQNGTNKNENLYGSEFDDVINGYAGNDNIAGRAGNNILSGGLGNDKFYIENIANTTNTITDFEISNYFERIVLSDFENINSISDLNISQVNNDVHIVIGETQKIILNNIDVNELKSTNFLGLDSNDTTNTEEETLEGTNLVGGKGDDTLIGHSGSDILNGSEGNDFLSGGAGSDTYFFNLGDGNDNIEDSSGNDKIIFGDGINTNDISFIINENDLFLNYGDNNEIKVSDHNSIEKVELADGSYLTNYDILNITQQMNSYISSNDLDIQNNNDVRNNENLMNIIQVSWNN